MKLQVNIDPEVTSQFCDERSIKEKMRKKNFLYFWRVLTRPDFPDLQHFVLIFQNMGLFERLFPAKPDFHLFGYQKFF